MLNYSEKKFLDNPKKAINLMLQHNEVLNITTESEDYVILNAEEWRNIYETLYLNSIKGLSESIIKASGENLDDSTPVDQVEW